MTLIISHRDRPWWGSLIEWWTEGLARTLNVVAGQLLSNRQPDRRHITVDDEHSKGCGFDSRPAPHTGPVAQR